MTNEQSSVSAKLEPMTYDFVLYCAKTRGINISEYVRVAVERLMEHDLDGVVFDINHLPHARLELSHSLVVEPPKPTFEKRPERNVVK